MKISKLTDFLQKRISPKLFKEEADDEFLFYKQQINRKKTSISINVDDDIDSFEINESHILFLCDAFLNKHFDKWELNYIADVILFSAHIKFKNEKVEDAINSLADSEYYKMINDSFIKRIVKKMGL